MKLLHLLFAPDGPASGGSPPASGSAESDLSETAQDLADLNAGGEEGEAEEEAEEEVPEGEEGEEAEEEGEEEEEEAEEEEGEEEEPPAEAEPVDGRPTVKQLKTAHGGKYADLFKDFPYLKRAFFEHQELSEVFADADSAREASSKAAEYDVIENTLVNQGSPDFLVKTLATNAPKSLRKIAAGFGEALRTHDEDSYRALANPIIEEVLYHASQYGQRTGGKQGQNIALAAQHIANFMWANGGQIPDITKREKVKPESEEVRALRTEREGYQRERFQTALSNVQSSCHTKLNAVIGGKVDGLTEFEKKQVIKETRGEVNSVLLNDRAFQNSLRSLWRRASEDNYSPASLARVENAWLARARAVAPGIRNRLRQEALDTRGGSSRRENAGGQQGKRTFRGSGGQQRPGSSQRVLDPHKIDWRKTSDADILGDDSSKVALKK